MKFLKQLFQIPETKLVDETGEFPEEQLAACILLMEIAGSDDQFSIEERQRIQELLMKEFQLDRDGVHRLMTASENHRKDAIDLWQFTNTLNQNLSKEEKIRVLENLWRIVYTDGRLDQHEDYLIHKLANLLRLQHSDLIGAKLRVKSG